jgi:hypothetical protein
LRESRVWSCLRPFRSREWCPQADVPLAPITPAPFPAPTIHGASNQSAFLRRWNTDRELRLHRQPLATARTVCSQSSGQDDPPAPGGRSQKWWVQTQCRQFSRLRSARRRRGVDAGLRISRRDHPCPHLALRNAATKSPLYRRHARQEAGGPRRPKEGHRDRGSQRIGPATLVEV